MDNLHDIITMEYHADISKNMERPITRGIKGKSQENITLAKLYTDILFYPCKCMGRKLERPYQIVNNDQMK